MEIPNEFTEAAVAAGSEEIETPYRDFVTSAEPYRSLLAKNPWLVPPKSGESLIWNEGRYYDTTIGRKHPYWRDQDLPTPTKNIHQLRVDLCELVAPVRRRVIQRNVGDLRAKNAARLLICSFLAVADGQAPLW